MRITNNEGFDMFFLRDDNIKKEDGSAKEYDQKKSEKKPVDEAELIKCRKITEIIKLVLLVLILITSSVAMVYALRIYYTQSDSQNLVFLESVMGKENQPVGELIVDTPEDLNTQEFTTRMSVDLSPEVVIQPDINISSGNKNNTADNTQNSVVTTVVSESTTIKDSSAQTTTAEKTDGIININFASAEQLMTLDGIGEKKANAIIAYRNENGAFLTVDELLEVDGIGEKTLEKLRPYVTVG